MPLSTDRIKGFVDAVVAISVTLLVLVVSLGNPSLGTLLFMTVPLLYVSHCKVDESWRTD